MTMYLSNRSIRSTGDEVVEFIDDPRWPDGTDRTPPGPGPDDEQEDSS
jgi:hypothetical protein